MNEERLEAYRNLIDALLNCNEGEEWQLLQAHQQLLDSDFIQVMEGVETQLAGGKSYGFDWFFAEFG